MSNTNWIMMKMCIKPILIIVMALTNVVSSTAGGNVLDAKQESIVAIAAFMTTGDQANLNTALHDGLDAGLTISEIKEVIVQLYAYAGFPRSLNALHTFMEVLKERKAEGKHDVEGKGASPYPVNKSKLEFGTENQTRLVGKPVKGEVYEFAPAIDQFLKEHLFGDIFGRDVLDYRTREIATISSLASLGGTENQLRSHFNVGLYNGLSEQQLERIVAIIRAKVGEVEANSAHIILREVLKRTEPPVAVSEGKSNFVGSVYVNMMVANDSIFNTQLASVTFESGARTNWHYHPSGQILIITAGSAYYQEKGKPKQLLLRGQVVKCSPNVPHWHGATENGPMTHLAMSSNMEKGPVVWMQPVTKEEYEK